MVYAGADPVTGKDIYLTESTGDEAKVEEIRTRLLAQVDRQRHAATKASLAYTLDEWLPVHEAKDSTIDNYRLLIEGTIKPALGAEPISRIGPRLLERFYAELRRCKARCAGRAYIEHRLVGDHECRVVRHRRKPGRPSAKSIAEHDCAASRCQVIECQPHQCEPLSPSTVRQIHGIIHLALAAAVRWEWIDNNGALLAKKPRQTPSKPRPPSATEAARIVAAAFEEDEGWGTLIWLKMATGARRGELLALRWHDTHLDLGELQIRRGYTRRNGKTRESTRDASDAAHRLDGETVELLRAHRRRREQSAEYLGSTLDESSYVFSYEADHSRPCNPDGISHKYARLCARLGIDSHLHTLRHYSATELLSSGVDLRTVAGRLGHGSGGATTLRVYAAWVPESDRRAAETLAGRMKSSRVSGQAAQPATPATTQPGAEG